MSEDKSEEKPSFNPGGAVKGAWDTFTAALTIKEQIASQNRVISEIVSEVKSVSKHMIDISVRMAKIEATLEAQAKAEEVRAATIRDSIDHVRTTNEVETRRIISEFMKDTKLHVHQFESQIREGLLSDRIKQLESMPPEKRQE